MKGLPAELTTELEKEFHSYCHLFQIDFASTLYYTDADKDILYGGNWWLSKGIEFDAVKLSTSPKVDSVSFAIDNVDRAFSAIVLGEEVRGKEGNIWRAAIDRNLSVVGIVKIFMGFVDTIEIDNKRANIQLYNHFIRWKLLSPRRQHAATCQWTFKGNYCTYSGGNNWCDHSWERCLALNNTLSYGGFKWLPYLIDKQIWWGKAPK